MLGASAHPGLTRTWHPWLLLEALSTGRPAVHRSTRDGPRRPVKPRQHTESRASQLAGESLNGRPSGLIVTEDDVDTIRARLGAPAVPGATIRKGAHHLNEPGTNVGRADIEGGEMRVFPPSCLAPLA